MDGRKIIIYSDIPANTVYQWTEEEGSSVHLSLSGNSNGLALDIQGRLLLAQHGKRQVALLLDDMTDSTLASHYDGKRLNSPNNMVVKSDGSIFFTDPSYGISSGDEESGFCGIYLISTSGKLYLLDKSLSRPNGIGLSPDETILYVADTETKKLFKWDIVDDTVIANKTEFVQMNMSGNGADGLTVDKYDFVYATGPSGIWIIHADGTVVDTILVSGQTTNCTLGGSEGNELFITSGNAVYRIINKIESPTSINAKYEYIQLSLYQNYPNPFSEETTLSFFLNKNTFVCISIFDSTGRLVDNILKKNLNAGEHRLIWFPKIADGVYYIHLQTPETTQIIQCIKFTD